ncbi:hypothetical protein KDA_76420 [Dictyobacter alpinus]|uniref:Uncharacterized protein n=1 Tax=Dictyobacter alpinus TaxID=2014873 RepID=A0A402BLB8_9CHLR|nr:hypothetical protein [Dictyobacter alpinus]GCE32158.1 hypothetical protein KDA_76420 [Dictyobacter alpinus]
MAEVQQERVIGAVKALILERKSFIGEVKSYLEKVAVVVTSEEEIEGAIARLFRPDNNTLMSLAQALLLGNVVRGVWHDEYSFIVARRSYKLFDNAQDTKVVYLLFSCIGDTIERTIDPYDSPEAVQKALESMRARVDSWSPLPRAHAEKMLADFKHLTMRISVTLS